MMGINRYQVQCNGYDENEQKIKIFYIELFNVYNDEEFKKIMSMRKSKLVLFGEKKK